MRYCVYRLYSNGTKLLVGSHLDLKAARSLTKHFSEQTKESTYSYEKESERFKPYGKTKKEEILGFKLPKLKKPKELRNFCVIKDKNGVVVSDCGDFYDAETCKKISQWFFEAAEYIEQEEKKNEV